MFLFDQITYKVIFSWLRSIWVILNKFLGRNLRFDLKWPLLILRLQDPIYPVEWCQTNILTVKKVQKTVTCARENSRKIQFCKSMSSKFWKILELETKILIYFSTPRNPNGGAASPPNQKGAASPPIAASSPTFPILLHYGFSSKLWMKRFFMMCLQKRRSKSSLSPTFSFKQAGILRSQTNHSAQFWRPEIVSADFENI